MSRRRFPTDIAPQVHIECRITTKKCPHQSPGAGSKVAVMQLRGGNLAGGLSPSWLVGALTRTAREPPGYEVAGQHHGSIAAARYPTTLTNAPTPCGRPCQAPRWQPGPGACVKVEGSPAPSSVRGWRADCLGAASACDQLTPGLPSRTLGPPLNRQLDSGRGWPGGRGDPKALAKARPVTRYQGQYDASGRFQGGFCAYHSTR